jgi:septal ring factor EnvC (AmiA/AmiB activator)
MIRYVSPVFVIMLLAGCATSTHYVETVAVPAPRAALPRTVLPNGAAGSGGYIWPVNGTVMAEFGDKVNSVINKGIDISAAEGGPVRAARDGKIVYCDPYLKGFGKTVIVDHGAGYQTVYAYNSEIDVRLGDSVSAGQVIARSGRTGRARAPSVHFEIRRNGEPQNPRRYLR